MKTIPNPPQLKKFEEIPGPPALPLLGNSLSFARKNRLEWLTNLGKEHGDIARIKFFEQDVILVQHPDWIRNILQKNYKSFSKSGKAIEKGKAVLGNGLFTSEGEFWRKQRKLAQPAFYKQRIEGLGQAMINCVALMLQEWEYHAWEGRIVDVADEMMRLTLQVVTQSMFGASLSEEDFQLFALIFPQIMQETNRRILNPFPFLETIPLKSSLDYDRNIKRLNDILQRIIEERKRSGKDGDDLLGMLMAAGEESGQKMSETQLRDEVMTIFIAGHETTAQALSWALYLLDQRPDVRLKLETEVDAVLGNRLPVPKDFRALPYPLKVFKETLRLYPPVPIYIRSSIHSVDIGGYEIHPNTRILIPPYLMHRNPNYWEDPESFDPERFAPDLEKERHKFVYFPFGGGPRICIGNNFALMEAVFAISMIAQRFRVIPIAPEKVEVDFTFTLRPRKGLPARILAR